MKRYCQVAARGGRFGDCRGWMSGRRRRMCVSNVCWRQILSKYWKLKQFYLGARNANTPHRITFTAHDQPVDDDVPGVGFDEANVLARTRDWRRDICIFWLIILCFMENLASTLGLSHETFLIWHNVWMGCAVRCLVANVCLSVRKVNYEHKSHTLSRAMGKRRMREIHVCIRKFIC